MVNLFGQLKGICEKIGLNSNPKIDKAKDFFYFSISDLLVIQKDFPIELLIKLKEEYWIECNIDDLNIYNCPLNVDDFIDIDNPEDVLKKRIEMYYNSISLNPEEEKFKKIKNRYIIEYKQKYKEYRWKYKSRLAEFNSIRIIDDEELKKELIRLNTILLFLEEYEDNFRIMIEATFKGFLPKIECRKMEIKFEEILYPEQKKYKGKEKPKWEILHFSLPKNEKK